MYVSVACDLNSDNSKKQIDSILYQYGFIKTQDNLYENNSINDNSVAKLKLEIDRNCDTYDQIRMFQFPLKHQLVISTLHEKRWKKKLIQDKSLGRGILC